MALPTPTNITELQSLQGKENILRHFICNFVEKMHIYMRLLKKDTPFFWDDQAQQAFDNLKHALTHSLVIHPLNYLKDFLLHFAASTTIIGIFLAQQDQNILEHVIYYASKNLLDFET